MAVSKCLTYYQLKSVHFVDEMRNDAQMMTLGWGGRAQWGVECIFLIAQKRILGMSIRDVPPGLRRSPESLFFIQNMAPLS